MQIVTSGDNFLNYHILFSGKNKQNITTLSSAELAKLRGMNTLSVGANSQSNFTSLLKKGLL